MQDHRNLFKLYADLLEYPTPSLRGRVDLCTQRLAVICPSAGDAFSGFQTWVAKEPIGRVEEIYTSAFDLQGICCPYVGHYLFGDNYQRSWFMAQLKQGYHNKKFSVGNELPDHVAVVLRFLAQAGEDEFSQVLLEEGLIPAVEKMVQMFDADGNHPYRQVLRSLLILLRDEQDTKEKNLVSSGQGGL